MKLPSRVGGLSSSDFSPDSTTLSSVVHSLETLQMHGGHAAMATGEFDPLHPGHVAFLDTARTFGDMLIVGLLSDKAIHDRHGVGRPFLSQGDRAAMLLALRSVDHVVIVDEHVPTIAIEQLRPDIYCTVRLSRRQRSLVSQSLSHYGGRLAILSDIKDYLAYAQPYPKPDIQQQPRSESFDHPSEPSADQEEQRAVGELLACSAVLCQVARGMVSDLRRVAAHMVLTLRRGNKVMVCGNGGSAADAQHFAAELVGRFRLERGSWAAIALCSDPCVMTSISNDYGFETIFARQIHGLGRPGDMLIAISTSGDSGNVLEAVKAANTLNVLTVGLTGARGGSMASLVDYHLAIPSTNTAIVQQAHTAVLHIIAGLVEARLATTSVH